LTALRVGSSSSFIMITLLVFLNIPNMGTLGG
jgi:hypothetical protein